MHTLICQHCRDPFQDRQPNVLFCPKPECQQARMERFKEQNNAALKLLRGRRAVRKKAQPPADHFCEGGCGRLVSHKWCGSPECLIKQRALYVGHRPGEFKTEEAPRKHSRKCQTCGKPAWPNYYICAHCHRAVSTYYVDPQATQYDPYRGQPRL